MLSSSSLCLDFGKRLIAQRVETQTGEADAHDIVDMGDFGVTGCHRSLWRQEVLTSAPVCRRIKQIQVTLLSDYELCR